MIFYQFKPTALAIAMAAAFFPTLGKAMVLVQEPPLPKTTATYVPPNVIISIDDSGSMGYKLVPSSASDRTAGIKRDKPDIGTDGWSSNTERLSVLKYAVKQVFNDKELLPDGSIRLAWQIMWNNGNGSGAGENLSKNANDVNQSGNHNMKILNSTHRQNFIDFIGWTVAKNGTPTHQMAYQAHKYMTDPLSKDGPWAIEPGVQGAPYLGCRRNYHILMSDGGWQTAPTVAQKPGNTDGGDKFNLPDGKEYDKVKPYTDTRTDMVADWAFKSWSTNLQTDRDPEGKKGLQGTPELGEEYKNAPLTENFGKDTTGKDAILEKYWNPRYNPATWPHLVTHTIGFSQAATTWSGEPSIKRPPNSHIVPFSYDVGLNGSLPDFITGNIEWPNLETGTEASKNSLDLWHSALNGRGRFYAVEKGEDLAKAFREIIQSINAENAVMPGNTGGNGTASGFNIAENNAGVFKAGYNPKDAWRGWLSASAARKPEEVECGVYPDEFQEEDEESSNSTPEEEGPCYRYPSTVAGWGGKNTAEHLDALTDQQARDSRYILTWNTDANQGKGEGSKFLWGTSHISPAQRQSLGTEDGVGKKIEQGKNILNYIRGDRSMEVETKAADSYEPKDANQPFRQRTSRQGDIVNSEVWYTPAAIGKYQKLPGYKVFIEAQKERTHMLYVGGNDGMLHGFSAEDGKEKIAYVPKAVYPLLKNLAAQNYNDNHRYFVDGSPMTADVKTGDGDQASDWSTLLVGTLGAGGKGYFVLDVTKPSSFSIDQPKAIVLMDKTFCTTGESYCTATTDEEKDIGHITALPARSSDNRLQATQITRLNNGRWAVIMGNGYNSANQRPVLLIQYLDGDRSLLSIQASAHATGTGNAEDNGLSAPALVDVDGNGTTDIVYAGDNLGNLWKFDLLSEDDSKWKPAFDIDTPFFTARGPQQLDGKRDQVQPITAAPLVRANERSIALEKGDEIITRKLGGLMIAFGTGRNLTAEDRSGDIEPSVQSLYAIADLTSYTIKDKKLIIKEADSGCTKISLENCVAEQNPLGKMGENINLAKQKFILINNPDDDSAWRKIESIDDLSNPASWKDFDGWYIDFPDKGERLLHSLQFYPRTNLLAVYSEVPDTTNAKNGGNTSSNFGYIESCTPAAIDTSRGYQWRTFINIMDGKNATFSIMDYNGNGVFDDEDYGIASRRMEKGSPMLMTDEDGGVENNEKLNSPGLHLRPNWRQLY